MYYSPSIYEDFVALYNLVVKRLHIQNSSEDIEPFTGDVEYIEELITRIVNPYTKLNLQNNYIKLHYRAKKRPIEKCLSYDIFKAMVQNLAEDTVDIDERVRKEIGTVENLGFEPVPEEQTEEEAAAIAEDLKQRKAESLKKSKQKPKTEEEEAQELESLIQKTTAELTQSLTKNNSEKIISAENEIELIKTRWLMKNHIIMDGERYDMINRKMSIYDIDIGSKDIILRLDLDIPLSKFVPPPKVNEMLSAGKSVDQPTSLGKDSKNKEKKSDAESVASVSPLGAEEEYWKLRQIMDKSALEKVCQELRFCTEKMANRVFIMGNLGERHGKVKGENSMKII